MGVCSGKFDFVCVILIDMAPIGIHLLLKLSIYITPVFLPLVEVGLQIDLPFLFKCIISKWYVNYYFKNIHSSVLNVNLSTGVK